MVFYSFVLFNREGDDNSAHDITELAISLRTEQMRIMTIDAGLGNCPVCIDCLEICLFPLGDIARVRLRRFTFYGRQTSCFEVSGRTIFLVNRKKACQTILEADAFLLHC